MKLKREAVLPKSFLKAGSNLTPKPEKTQPEKRTGEPAAPELPPRRDSRGSTQRQFDSPPSRGPWPELGGEPAAPELQPWRDSRPNHGGTQSTAHKGNLLTLSVSTPGMRQEKNHSAAPRSLLVSRLRINPPPPPPLVSK